MIKPPDKFWETIYSRNIGKMIGICYRYTANRQLSEDLAHDAFLKAINKSATFEGRGHFEAWLRRIVVNHALQYIREQRKKRHIEESLEHDTDVIESDDNQTSNRSSLHTEFSEAELLEAINELPEHHRLVFNLYVVDNFTHAQIGEMLGISEGTSKSHLARARKKLQQLLEEKAATPRRSKVSWLFLFFSPRQAIDKIFRKIINDLDIKPNHTAPPELSGAHQVTVQGLSQATSWSWGLTTAAVSIGVVVTTTLVVLQDKSVPQHQAAAGTSKSAPQEIGNSSDQSPPAKQVTGPSTTGKKKFNVYGIGRCNPFGKQRHIKSKLKK